MESSYIEAELTRLERLQLKDLVAVEGIFITRDRGEVFYIVKVVGLELIIAVKLDTAVIYYAKLTQILFACEISKS